MTRSSNPRRQPAHCGRPERTGLCPDLGPGHAAGAGRMSHPGGASAGGIALHTAPGCARSSLLRPRRPRATRSAALSPEGPSSVHGSHLPRRTAGRSLLGAGSAIYGGQLQEYIDHEAADWRTYLSLSRRSPGGCARVLAAMAAEERRHAKRLSAAYFLISGVRYFPSESSLPTPRGALPAALRQCFCAEQRGALAYLAAAEECSDPALRALYQELAWDEARHAQLLRELVEEL